MPCLPSLTRRPLLSLTSLSVYVRYVFDEVRRPLNTVAMGLDVVASDVKVGLSQP